VLIRAPEVERPSASAVDAALADLERALGSSKVDTSEAARTTCARDESEAFGVTPDGVVHAVDASDVARVLAIASERGVPVTPRAGGTGRSGGAVPAAGGIVLDTSTMGRIKEIDRAELVCVVEPGVVTGALHAACEAEGLFYPPDPNSWKTCMIGGNVAENAGGPRAFKYGSTQRWVLGTEACLMGGRVVRTGRRTVKGVSGYDVTSLLVGSEGTLAVLSEVTLRLVRKPEAVATLLGLCASARDAAAAVTALVTSGLVPRCVELMDAWTLEAVRRQGAAVDPRAGALLLVELDGETREVEAALERAGGILAAAPGSIEVQVAQDAAQRDRLWEARRSLSPATKKLAKYKLSEDVVVPRTRIADLLDETARSAEALGVRHLTYGHAGDGNLHVNFLWDDDGERSRVDAAIASLMKTTVALGGTLTGEHGIGITKIEYLPLEQSADLIALQEDVKRAFDPQGLLNPGKIFAPRRGHGAC
jgi:glycolate oxidase